LEIFKKKNQQQPSSNDDSWSAQEFIGRPRFEDFSEATLGSIYPYVVPGSWIEHLRML
jgi:hypothetical protein